MAPTQTEIREAIDDNWPAFNLHFEDVFTEAQRLLGGLWDEDDLRPSEDERLGQLLTPRLDAIADETRQRITDTLEAAALAFAAEYPDAPRAKRPEAA